MSELRTIQIIRHTSTALNGDPLTDRLRGWMDLPLSPQGRQEASGIMLPQLPDVIYSSDLTRAVETTEIIIGKNSSHLFNTRKAFRPWNIGEFAGHKAIEVVARLGMYADQKPMEPVPGGESFADFRKRFLAGLYEALDEHKGLIAIVTHHRCERLLKAWEAYGYRLDGSIDQDVFTAKGIPPGGVQVMRIPADRLYHASVWPKVPRTLVYQVVMDELMETAEGHNARLHLAALRESRRR